MVLEPQVQNAEVGWGRSLVHVRENIFKDFQKAWHEFPPQLMETGSLLRSVLAPHVQPSCKWHNKAGWPSLRFLKWTKELHSEDPDHQNLILYTVTRKR